MVKSIIFVCCLFLPVAVWAFFKPARILAPEFVSGITCNSSNICLDDASRYIEAVKLYEESINFVTSKLGKIRKNPKIIFCSKESCFNSFGFNKASAKTMGTSGIVISPRGWKYYYLRHEIIHHLQSEKMGVISQWRSPKWFTEGMAYSLSEDPRKKLSLPFNEYRNRFTSWYKSIGNNNVWEEASNI